MADKLGRLGSNMKLLVLSLILFSSLAGAVVSGEQDSKKARLRQYSGGIDEEDLKVRDPLPAPKIKISHKSVQAQVFKDLFKEKEEKNKLEK